MTESISNLWLKQWVFYSLQTHLSSTNARLEYLDELSQLQPAHSLIIGISGAQGSGKSSLAGALQQLWITLGVQSDIVSLDDYYLEPAQRLQQAKLRHPLFAERGVPGTHDTQLLLSQLQGFKQGVPQCWHRYNKALDRASKPKPATTARLLIVEGWCVGLQAQRDCDLVQSVNLLEQHYDPNAVWRHQVNQYLNGDYQLIWQQLNSLVWLNAPDWQAVCRWRAWQELPLQQQGKGKSPVQLERFMWYFQRLTIESWRQLPDLADFILNLDQAHNFISLTPAE